MNKWNGPKIMADHGGPVDLHAKLKAHGHTVALHTVQAWDRRKRIPGDWVATLLAMRGVNPRGWIETETVEDIF